MRLRFPELLEEHGQLSAYALAKRSGGRIPTSTAYRLVETRGHLKHFRAELLDALCDVLGVSPGELFAPSLKRGKRRA